MRNSGPGESGGGGYALELNCLRVVEPFRAVK
jgi:hypothetical protein